MTRSKAKKTIRDIVRNHCVSYTKHVRERMQERGVTTEDLLHVLLWGEIVTIDNDNPPN